MNMRTLAASLLLFLIGIVVGIMVGFSVGADTVCKQALEKGVAEYVLINKTTGQTSFVWKEIPKH